MGLHDEKHPRVKVAEYKTPLDDLMTDLMK